LAVDALALGRAAPCCGSLLLTQQANGMMRCVQGLQGETCATRARHQPVRRLQRANEHLHPSPCCLLLCSRSSLATLVQRRHAIPVAGAMLEAPLRPPPLDGRLLHGLVVANGDTKGPRGMSLCTTLQCTTPKPPGVEVQHMMSPLAQRKAVVCLAVAWMPRNAMPPPML
jgi:hypothetical protein